MENRSDGWKWKADAKKVQIFRSGSLHFLIFPFAKEITRNRGSDYILRLQVNQIHTLIMGNFHLPIDEYIFCLVPCYNQEKLHGAKRVYVG